MVFRLADGAAVCPLNFQGRIAIVRGSIDWVFLAQMFIRGIQIPLCDVRGHRPVGFFHHMQIAAACVQRLSKVQMAHLPAIHYIEQIADSPIVEMEDMFFLVYCDHAYIPPCKI